MSDKLTFCPAGFEDLPPLLRWSVRHVKEYETAKLDWKHVEEILSEKLRQELPCCRRIYKNGKKIGYFSLLQRPEYLELNNFWIFLPFRGQGIGSQVLQYCKGEARKASLPLRLFVFTKNKGAVRFYKRWGFLETSRFYQSRILMEYRPD